MEMGSPRKSKKSCCYSKIGWRMHFFLVLVGWHIFFWCSLPSFFFHRQLRPGIFTYYRLLIFSILENIPLFFKWYLLSNISLLFFSVLLLSSLSIKSKNERNLFKKWKEEILPLRRGERGENYSKHFRIPCTRKYSW